MENNIHVERTRLVWQYFTHDELAFKCNICGKSYNDNHPIQELEKHMILDHREIITEIQNNIIHSGVTQFFTFRMRDFQITCNICERNFNISIVYINDLREHLSVDHDMRK